MEATLLTVGLVCVVAAIVGGGLKAFNIELPGLASVGRQLLLGGFGVVLVVVGLLGLPASVGSKGAPSGVTFREDTPSEQASAETAARPCAAQVSFGEAVECAITRPGQERSHVFQAGKGDRVAVQVTGAVNLSPETEVLRPDGTLECGPGYGDIEECTLDAAGAHRVVVRDGYGSKTGSYVLRLERL